MYPGPLVRNKQFYSGYIIVGTCIATFLPMVILTVLSVLILWKVRQQRIGSQQTNVMILAVLFSFVVLRVPVSVTRLLATFLHGDDVEKTLGLLKPLSMTLALLNSAWNITIYCVASPTFRHRLVAILCLGAKRSTRVTATTATMVTAVPP